MGSPKQEMLGLRNLSKELVSRQRRKKPLEGWPGFGPCSRFSCGSRRKSRKDKRGHGWMSGLRTVGTSCLAPTRSRRTNERRQSHRAPWCSFWKTRGCSSSKMPSTCKKKARWFCCRNSWKFRCVRPCRRAAIMGRCLEAKRRAPRVMSSHQTPQPHGMPTSVRISTLAAGWGGPQPASDRPCWHRPLCFQKTGSHWCLPGA